jgi:hypothetical protein
VRAAGPGGRSASAFKLLSAGTVTSTGTAPKLSDVRSVTKSLTGVYSTRYAGAHSGVVRCWSLRGNSISSLVVSNRIRTLTRCGRRGTFPRTD